MKKRFSEEQIVKILQEAEIRYGSRSDPKAQHLRADVLPMEKALRRDGCERSEAAQRA